jgi:putative nucleotidyltransferase with HDIG domain
MSKTLKDTRGMPAVRKRAGSRVGPLLVAWSPFFILAALSVCLALLFPYHGTVRKFDLPKVGAAATETIIAPFTFDIVRSPEELERERRKSVGDVLLVMDYDSAASEDSYRKIAELWEALSDVVYGNMPDSIKAASSRVLARTLSGKALDALRRRPALFDDASQQLTSLMERGVSASLLYSTNEQLNDMRLRFNTQFAAPVQYSKKYISLMRGDSDSVVAVADIPVKEVALERAVAALKSEKAMDDEALNTVYEVLYACVRPNIRVNNRLTAERRQEAAADVLEISGKVIKDTEIVRKHQEVTPEILQKLQSLHIAIERMEGELEKRRADAAYTGRIILALIPLVFLSLYLKKYKPSLVNSAKSLLALALVVRLQVLIIRVGVELFPRLFEVWEMSAASPEYLIPVTMAAVLCTILFGFQVSTLVSLYISIYFGLVFGFSQFFFLYAFMNSVVAAFLNYRIRYRWHFFKAIPFMFAMSVVIIAVWHLIGLRFDYFLVNIGCALTAIVASVFLTMMLSPVFERLFDITTDMTLIELSDMNHPILKRLSIEAAGTYNHSVLVGNLAESAAQAVGANALLARVASYYHDIGKIDKPDYFVENCLGDKNRHNKLSPSMSALIICSHVKEGVDLAKKYRLPKVIQDIIMQHHGTSSVSFFYEKALEQDPHKQVQEKDFRYPGPTPQTREAGIIMLADSVEAASRSLATSSPKLLRELVKKIIRDKFLSSQLDQCNLTLRDLNDITDGFMPVLQGIFHSRIEYPNK